MMVFSADPVTYVVPAVVLASFYLHHRAQKLAGLR